MVDDDAAVGMILGDLLTQAGYTALVESNGAAALERLARAHVDLLITDLRMPGMDGMQLLDAVRERFAALPVVMISAFGTIASAVEAMKRGAADFVTKPFDRDELLYVISKALATAAPDVGVPPEPGAPGELLGDSPAIRECRRMISRVAPADASVLLRGESGTGKELAALAIHKQSPRAHGPFVPIHCAAVPENLLESELFGYEKGAFTGAVNRKPGRVELAEGGTLFLDEVGDIALGTQVKLLRLIQEREFQRLGATRGQRIDVRFVAATHRDLEAMVKAGQFREDLFFRLNVVPIRMPALRERPTDIPLLAQTFCARLGPANRRPNARLDPSALEVLSLQRWPGNVRELQNFIERLVVMSDNAVITGPDVHRELSRADGAAGPTSTNAAAGARPSDPSLESRRKDAEREALHEALARAGNNRSLAARILGVSRRTLYYKLAEHGLE